MGRQTKFQEVCSQITDLAHELGPDAKLPTVIQLRDRLGVSIATLNTVLTELEAQQVVRRRHGVGIYVAPQIRQHRVCLICDPSFFRVAGTSPFWGLLVEQVRQRAELEHEAFSFHFATDILPTLNEGGNDTHTTNAPLLADSLVEDIKNGRIDGILGVGLPEVTAEWIQQNHIPFVAFAGPGDYFYGVDSENIAATGVQMLAAEGCQQIAFWSALAPYRYSRPTDVNRPLMVFEQTLAELGLPYDPNLAWDNRHLVPEQGGVHTLTHQEQGYHAGMEVFGPHTDPAEWPDGIFSADDMLTQGLLTALQRLGVRVGEDVKIATHANVGSPVLIGWEDRLILLEVNPKEIVDGMFDALEKMMRGEPVPERISLVKPRVRLPGEL